MSSFFTRHSDPTYTNDADWMANQGNAYTGGLGGLAQYNQQQAANALRAQASAAPAPAAAPTNRTPAPAGVFRDLYGAGPNSPGSRVGYRFKGTPNTIRTGGNVGRRPVEEPGNLHQRIYGGGRFGQQNYNRGVPQTKMQEYGPVKNRNTAIRRLMKDRPHKPGVLATGRTPVAEFQQTELARALSNPGGYE